MTRLSKLQTRILLSIAEDPALALLYPPSARRRQTFESLVKRGLLVVLRHKSLYAWEWHLTSAGREVARSIWQRKLDEMQALDARGRACGLAPLPSILFPRPLVEGPLLPSP